MLVSKELVHMTASRRIQKGFVANRIIGAEYKCCLIWEDILKTAKKKD